VRNVLSVSKESKQNGQDSGHGSQVTCKHHTETDGKDEGIFGSMFALRIWSHLLVIYGCNGRYIIDNVRLSHTLFLDFGLVMHSQKLRKALVDPLPPGSKLFVSEYSKALSNSSSSTFPETGTMGLLPLWDDFGSVLMVLPLSWYPIWSESKRPGSLQVQ